jgi:hypothetical protein
MKKTILVLLAIAVLAGTAFASYDSFDKKYDDSSKYSDKYSDKYTDKYCDSNYGHCSDGCNGYNMERDCDKRCDYYGIDEGGMKDDF